MENEVIIDGVNVAECEHLLSDGKRKPICKSGGSCRVYKSCLCVDNSDCHFKQLQRAKAEITHWSGLANEANERATEYGNECIKVEEEVRYYKELASDNERNLRLAHQDFTDFIQKQKLEISELEAENEKLKAELDNYRRVD